MKKFTSVIFAMLISVIAVAQFNLSKKTIKNQSIAINNNRTPVTTISYCVDEVTDALGTNTPSNISAAIELPAATMSNYVGNFINKISVGVNPSTFSSLNIRIWSDISTGEGTIIYDEVIDKSTLVDGWNEIPLSTPFEIDGSRLYVGYTVAATGNACYLDTQPAEANGYGDLIYSDVYTPDGWNNIHIIEPMINFNWHIKTYIDDGNPLWDDIAIIDYSIPNSNCSLGSNEQITAVIQNTGTNDLSAPFDMACALNNDFSNEVTTTVNTVLAIGETTEVSFNIDLSEDNTYTIKIYPKLETDGVPMNDTVVKTIVNAAPASLPYLEDFEMENLAWNVEDVNTDGNTWGFLNNPQVNPSPCMSYLYGTENSADDYLFSTCVDLNSTDTYKLKFNYFGGYAQTDEQLKIFIGTAPNATAMTTELAELNIENSQVAEYELAFTVNSDDTYYIGFQALGTPEAYKFIVVDHFYIEAYNELDAGVVAIINMNSSCDLGMKDITVSVSNYGSANLTNVPVSYTVNGGTAVTETIPVIDFDTTVEYTFATQADLSVVGDTYVIGAYTSLTGDANTANDAAEDVEIINVETSSTPFINNFNNESTLLGWNIEDANHDGRTWSFYDENGEQYMGYNNSSENNADDYLFSTCIDLSANNTYSLSFKYAVMASNYPEKLKVMIGDSQNANAMNTVIVDLGTFSNTEFRESITNNITVASDGTYYLGFYAYSDFNMWRLKLDEIQFTSNDNISDITMSNINIYPNPTNNKITVENAIKTNITIINLLGQTIVPTKNINNATHTIDVSTLPNGTYILHIENGQTIHTQKINVTH